MLETVKFHRGGKYGIVSKIHKKGDWLMRKFLWFSVLLLTMFLAACEGVNGGPDLSGTWQGEYTRVMEGDSTEFAEVLPVTLTLTQQQNALSGTMSSPGIMDSTITGTVLGNAVALTVSDANTVLLTGKFEGASLIASVPVRDTVNYTVTLSVER